MATVKDYKDLIAAEFMNHRDVQRLYGFDENEPFEKHFSAASVESILFYVFAFGMWAMATLFDRHRADVEAELEALKPHTLLWYVSKAKAYQHGDALPTEHDQVVSDVYETPDEAKRIVKYAVARESGNTVMVKVAKYSEDGRTPDKLDTGELRGLKQYFSEVKDAGVQIQIISNAADLMAVDVTIFYNPMLLSFDGGELKDGEGNEVVRIAIEQVVENLPFNGDCKTSSILGAITGIKGVEVADVTKVGVWNGGEEPDNLEGVVGFCTPASGYFKLERLTIKAEQYGNGMEIRDI